MNYSFNRRCRCLLLVFENRRIDLEHDAEDRSAADVAADFDASAVLPDDVLRDPQTQAGSLLAGREKRIEDASEIVLGNADAAVVELDNDRRLQRLLVTRGRNTD